MKRLLATAALVATVIALAGCVIKGKNARWIE